MIRYEEGQLFKPKNPNRFWKTFRILRLRHQDTTLNYDVMCYGYAYNREMTMYHKAMEETLEKITKESFKNIMQ